MTRGGKRKGAGRPRAKTTKAANLNIRTTSERLQAWRQAAIGVGMLLSPWVEMVLDKEAERLFEEDRKWINKLDE